MASKRTGLGRGLGALIKEVPTGNPDQESPGITRIPLASIDKNRWQPRRVFAPGALEDLVHSIRVRGVLQPLLVRKDGERYQLIAGERRLRAAQEAHLEEVPAVVMDVSDQEALELALVENLQREDLNPVEEAEGYRLLAENFSMTQEQIAERVGKARATVANVLRLLDLPESVRALVSDGRLTPGHAKVLLGLAIEEEQQLLAERAVQEGLSVRALENVVEKLKRPPRKPRASKSDLPSEHVRYLSERLHQHLGTSVRITPCRTLANGKKARGCVEIDFYSSDDLDRLLGLLGLVEEI